MLLFVCRGNTCRSPLAAAVARARGVAAQSAGIEPSPGDAATPHALRVARQAGLDLSDHTPAGVEDVDLSAVDRVVALSPAVAQHLRQDDPFEAKPDSSPLLTVWHVPDPVGGSVADYRLCLHEIERSVDALLA